MSTKKCANCGKSITCGGCTSTGRKAGGSNESNEFLKDQGLDVGYYGCYLCDSCYKRLCNIYRRQTGWDCL